MRLLHFLPLLFILCFLQSSLVADEGMWMPHQMKMLNLEAKGLKMDPDGLYKEDGTSLMSAVVNLGGGTGSFVTDKFSSATHLIKEMGIVN
ncbi:MAG: S46 family peptidase [Calditrichia bacterium]|nr:S46 family peptidase [Calditrichia bacterium]